MATGDGILPRTIRSFVIFCLSKHAQDLVLGGDHLRRSLGPAELLPAAGAPAQGREGDARRSGRIWERGPSSGWRSRAVDADGHEDEEADETETEVEGVVVAQPKLVKHLLLDRLQVPLHINWSWWLGVTCVDEESRPASRRVFTL